MFCISAAAEEDIPLIYEIEREAISPPWTIGTLTSEAYRDDSFFVIARVTDPAGFRAKGSGLSGQRLVCGGEVLGFVILRRIVDEGELLQIAVDKTARRCGIADALMKAALSFTGEHALRAVHLEVRKSNAAATGLYNKHGFKTVHYRKEYYSDPVEDAVVMTKEF